MTPGEVALWIGVAAALVLVVSILLADFLEDR